MAYVKQVNFDSHWYLAKPSFVFKYREREYRLLRGKGRGRNKELDCVLTILSSYDDEEDYIVSREIMIYLGCLSWEYRTPIIIEGGGGYGSAKKITIKKVRRVDVTKRTLPTTTHYLSIEKIPYVQTKDQEDAIGLYREALAGRSPFYKFLCLWNILNIPTRKVCLVINWLNNTITTKKHRIYHNKYIEDLIKKGINIGEYFADECRNAIAHIRRDSPTKTHIDPNDGKDFSRIASSAYFLEDLAKLYIIEELKLDKRQFLYKRKKRDIPEYLTEEEINKRLGM